MQEYAPKIFKIYIPSKSGIKKAIKRGEFYCNGIIAQTSTWIKEGQRIDLIVNLNKKPKVFEYSLEVVFEDENVAVINKPAGINVSGNTFKTIFNALPFNLKTSSEVDSLLKPTPVHRLDNQTSGLLLIAKTKMAQVELGSQFENKSIQKKYETIVIGNPNQHGTISSAIENKPSETYYENIRVVKSLKYDELSLLSVYPKTGRTHQIRIHLATIGYPILGDKLYGESTKIHKGKGLFLAATEITFSHPKTKEIITLSIAIPTKFESLLKREERRWNSYNLTK